MLIVCLSPSFSFFFFLFSLLPGEQWRPFFVCAFVPFEYFLCESRFIVTALMNVGECVLYVYVCVIEEELSFQETRVSVSLCVQSILGGG